MFILNPHIFFTKGAQRGTLFDGNTGSLYWLSPAASRYLSDAQAGNPEENLSPLLKHLVRELERLALGTSFSQDPSSCRLHEPCLDKVEHRLSLAYYEVTPACNLSCIHCYANAGAASSEATGAHARGSDESGALLREIASSGVRRIQFIGGEPFLRWDRLKRLCASARKYFEQVEISTNGTLLKHGKVISFIKANDIKLSISLYSHDAATHDSITRSPGSHALTMKALSELEKEKISFYIAFVLMDQNRTLRHETIDFIRHRFGQEVRPKPLRMTGRAVSALNRDAPQEKRIGLRNFEGAFEKQDFLYNRCFHNCYGRGPYVAVDGNVYPCVMERRLSIGNVRKNRWHDILGSSAFDEATRLNKDKIDGCRMCEFRYLCFDCRPDASGLNSNFLSKPWNCTYTPEKGRWDIDDRDKSPKNSPIIKLTKDPHASRD